MDQVTVYSFQVYDITSDQYRTSLRMATEDAISRARGIALDGSARKINVVDLDPAQPGMTPRNFQLKSDRTGFQTQVK